MGEITIGLRSLPSRWVDRQTLQDLLQVGRRRAQQILAPCAGRQIGASLLADREVLIEHLQRLVDGEAVYHERQRRLRLAAALKKPRLLVEAPVSITNQRLENIPEGITIEPGQLRVSFRTPVEALEKLLALAMAIGNSPEQFEDAATGSNASARSGLQDAGMGSR